MKVKKLLCVALAVSMLGTSSAIFTANAKETTSYKLGDVNLDGVVRPHFRVDNLSRIVKG